MQALQTTVSAQALAAALAFGDDARGRLLAAMAQSVIEKGFARTVVADVVRIAHVSRRTFYEHFSDREDCFLALAEAFGEHSRAVIADAADPALPWQDQARAAIAAHSGLLTTEPALTRSVFFEIYSVGEHGVRAHRRINLEFAKQLHDLAGRARRDDPALNAVSLPTASALIAAIGELAMLALERPGDARFAAETERTAFTLLAAAFTARVE